MSAQRAAAPGPPAPPPLLITGHARRGDTEAVVLRVRRQPDGVEAGLLLADGTAASARIDPVDWDWLDVRCGDIVAVAPAPAPEQGVSG